VKPCPGPDGPGHGLRRWAGKADANRKWLGRRAILGGSALSLASRARCPRARRARRTNRMRFSLQVNVWPSSMPVPQ
jgi:hypothetical protein